MAIGDQTVDGAQVLASTLKAKYNDLIREALLRSRPKLDVTRADEISLPGTISTDIITRIMHSDVVIADVTYPNSNVFYELGLAHAMKKPVVLVSAKEDDVPFDLQHIRVIYYDMSDPFWGNKLIEKVAENILSAIQNPEEAVFKSTIGGKDF